MPELELPCGQTCTAVSVKMYRKYTEIMERNEDGAIEDAVDAIARADLMIIGGTSLAVYPAAGFAANYRGKLVIINRSPTPMDARADLLISAPIGQTMKAVMACLEEDQTTNS